MILFSGMTCRAIGGRGKAGMPCPRKIRTNLRLIYNIVEMDSLYSINSQYESEKN